MKFIPEVTIGVIGVEPNFYGFKGYLSFKVEL